MFQIKCAGLVFEVHDSAPNIYEKCKNYVVIDEPVDCILKPSKRHFDIAEDILSNESKSTIEFAALYCCLSEELLQTGESCCIHAAAVAVDNNAFLFAAPSGIGKSTQAMLWKKHFGDSCKIINGDKPIVSFYNNKPYVGGSPWCGKEGLSENITVPIRGICFLERADVPAIRKLSDTEVIDRLFFQLSLPETGSGLSGYCLAIANRLLKSVPFFLLKCNMKNDSVLTAYGILNQLCK